MDDALRVLLVQPLPSNQAGCHESGILPQPSQELAIDALLEAQDLVAVDKLCVLQYFRMLAALGRRSFRAVNIRIFQIIIYE